MLPSLSGFRFKISYTWESYLVKGDALLPAESNNLTEVHVRKAELYMNADHLEIPVCKF